MVKSKKISKNFHQLRVGGKYSWSGIRKGKSVDILWKSKCTIKKIEDGFFYIYDNKYKKNRVFSEQMMIDGKIEFKKLKENVDIEKEMRHLDITLLVQAREEYYKLIGSKI